ncbi:MAG: hypothetical protein V2J07_05485 [Anaerolineae bacterium]|nr:hypothetical protein [Anaerolineae bacterium]
MKKKLERAIQLSKSGEKDQARVLLRELVDESPELLNAWFWLADAMPTDEQRIPVLQEALSHHAGDPRLTGALSRMLTTLREQGVTNSPAAQDEFQPQNLEESVQPEIEEEPSETLDSSDEFYVSDLYDEEKEDSIPDGPPLRKTTKKGSTNLQYLFVVFLLLIAALVTAYLFRDSLVELWGGGTQAVVMAPSVTSTVLLEIPTETPQITETATVTATPIPPTQTKPVSSGESTPTQVILTTPTNTAVVEEGIFIAVPGGELNDICWSSDGELFAVAGDGGIMIYNGETFTLKLHITLDPAIPVGAVTFSPDGAFIAAGFDQGNSGEELITRARMWKVSDGAEVLSFDYNAPRGDITSLAFSSDGETLLMNAKLDAILKWRVSDGALLEVFKLSESSVDYYGVAFSPDRLSFATFSKFDRVRLYDTLFGEQTAVLGEEKDISNAVFSANSQYLAVMFEERSDVYLWDLPSKEKIKAWNTFGGNVTTLAFDADNQTLAVGTDEDLIKFYQIRTGEEQRVISRQIPGVQEMEFAPDDILFAVRNEREIQIWHLLTDTLVATFRVID